MEWNGEMDLQKDNEVRSTTRAFSMKSLFLSKLFSNSDLVS